MPLTITETNKNSLTITPEGKPTASNLWSERDLLWVESGAAGDTWAVPGTALTKQSKNSLTITNETKN